jgi:hypothetical protein
MHRVDALTKATRMSRAEFRRPALRARICQVQRFSRFCDGTSVARTNCRFGRAVRKARLRNDIFP